MSRSPSIIGALLILGSAAVVLSFAIDERIGNPLGAAMSPQVRNVRASESRAERFDVSREEETLMRLRIPRLVKEPSPSVKENVTDSPAKTPTTIGGEHKDNSTLLDSEVKDMTSSHVSPKDDDDDEVVEKKNEEKKVTGVDESTGKNSTSPVLEMPVEIPGVNDKLKYDSIPETVSNRTKNATIAAPVAAGESPKEIATSSTTVISTTSTSEATTNATETVPVVINATVSAEKSEAITTSASTNISSSSSDLAWTISTKAAISVTRRPTAAIREETPVTASVTLDGDETRIASTAMYSSSFSEAEDILHKKKRSSMPSGIVALITAIAFAILAVTAYIGLIAWRRYHEWRYGNRELLVNEFDSNDIGNFEL